MLASQPRIFVHFHLNCPTIQLVAAICYQPVDFSGSPGRKIIAVLSRSAFV